MAVGEHHFEPEHLIARHAITQHVIAAGIGGEIASDLARSGATVIEAEQPPCFGGGGLRLVQSAAGLDHNDVIHRSKSQNTAHPLERYDNGKRAILRRRAAGQPGAAAARHDRNVGRRASPNDSRHLIRATRSNHQDRGFLRRAGQIAAIRRDIMRRREHAVVANDALQRRQ